MKVIKYLVIIIPLLLFSCVTDPEEYIPVNIINNTSEDLSVSAGGFISFSSTVPKNSSYTIIAIKGNSISIIGKESNKNYGSRTFYSEGTWTVN
ncbi:MAG: hypothetical protein LBV17_01465 [Treponema sp.]|nr:hypothetical protein [Treponema sp.]